jgi:hypothetical protein
MAEDKTLASVKEQEQNFATMALGGAISSVVEIPAALIDLGSMAFRNVRRRQPGEVPLPDQVRERMKNLFGVGPDKPGSEAGFSFGNVTGNVGQVFADPLVPVAKAGLFLSARVATTAKSSGGLGRLAQQMADNGATPMEIWQKLKVFNLNQGVKNAKPDWAVHVATDALQLDLAKPSASWILNKRVLFKRFGQGMEIKLKDALGGLPPELTKNYADTLEQWTIKLSDLPDGTRGQVNSSSQTLEISKALYDSATGTLTEQGRKTLVHELQHVIQAEEWWVGQGSNRLVASRQVGQVGNVIRDYITQKADEVYPYVEKYWQSEMLPLINKMYETGDQAEKLKYAEQLKNLYETGPLGVYAKELRTMGIKIPDWVTWGNWGVGQGTFAYPLTNPTLAKHAVSGWTAPSRGKAMLPYNITHRFYENDLGEIWARAAAESRDYSQSALDITPPWRFMDTPPSQALSANEPNVGMLGDLTRRAKIAESSAIRKTSSDVSSSAELTPEQELKALMEQQVADLKQARSEMTELMRKEYERLGIKIEDIPPMRVGDKQTYAFPSKDPSIVWDSEGMQVKGPGAEQGTEYSQHQYDPQKQSGGKPQDPASWGETAIQQGAYANARADHWGGRSGVRGFDAEKFKNFVEATRYSSIRNAAKGKAGANPEFWVYEEKTQKLFVVKREPDGTLYIGRKKGRGIKPDDLIKSRDEAGNPVYKDTIDAVVWDNAEQRLKDQVAKALKDL